MSAITPYVAPWRSDWTRYSTQLFAPDQSDPDQATLTVSEGQWWRIVYLSAQLTTDANATPRTMRLLIFDAHAFLVLQVAASTGQPASSSYTYLYAPGITTFANTADPINGHESVAIPDLLWPQRARFTLTYTHHAAGDAWVPGANVFAVEVYTEDRGGVDSAATVPATPLLG